MSGWTVKAVIGARCTGMWAWACIVYSESGWITGGLLDNFPHLHPSVSTRHPQLGTNSNSSEIQKFGDGFLHGSQERKYICEDTLGKSTLLTCDRTSRHYTKLKIVMNRPNLS